MTQHAPKSTASGAALVWACLIFASLRTYAGADPIEPPAPHPLQVLLAPETPTYKVRFSEEGESLVVARIRYVDDTVVSHAVGALLRGTALPLELVFLDTFQPAPQATRAPATTPATTTHLTPVAEPLPAGLSRTLDFSPQTPFRVRVRQMPGFVDPAVLLRSRDSWETLAPRCLKDEWLAVARVHPSAANAETAPIEFGALKGNLDELVAQVTGSVQPDRTAAPLAPARPYYSFGEFVCVSFLEHPPGALPGR